MKVKGFTIMRIMKNLPLDVLGMLATLLSVPAEKWRFTVEGFAKILPDKSTKIRKCITMLEEEKYLIRKREYAAGINHMKYIYNDEPIQESAETINPMNYLPRETRKSVHKNFVIIPNTILHDRNVSLTERGLYILLKSLPKSWYFTISGLTTITNFSRNTVKKYLDKLLEHKYLNLNMGWRYTIADDSNKEITYGQKQKHNSYNNNYDGDKEETRPAKTMPEQSSEEKAEVKKLLESNINWSKNEHKEQVAQLIDIMTNVICSNKQSVRVNQQYISKKVVKEQFFKLKDRHIEYVIKNLSEYQDTIKNPTAFATTVLYNASLLNCFGYAQKSKKSRSSGAFDSLDFDDSEYYDYDFFEDDYKLEVLAECKKTKTDKHYGAFDNIEDYYYDEDPIGYRLTTIDDFNFEKLGERQRPRLISAIKLAREVGIQQASKETRINYLVLENFVAKANSGEFDLVTGKLDYRSCGFSKEKGNEHEKEYIEFKKQAKQRAKQQEEERKKQAEEERKRQEEERKKQAEEERKRQEEERKRQEEERKKQAEEEYKRRKELEKFRFEKARKQQEEKERKIKRAKVERRVQLESLGFTCVKEEKQAESCEIDLKKRQIQLENLYRLPF